MHGRWLLLHVLLTGMTLEHGISGSRVARVPNNDCSDLDGLYASRSNLANMKHRRKGVLEGRLEKRDQSIKYKILHGNMRAVMQHNGLQRFK